MADPSKERIAAALALAEAVDRWSAKMGTFTGSVEGRVTDDSEEWSATCETLTAFRATAPKLRTRAEVDAEIVSRFRSAYASGSLVGSLVEIGELCREETAPQCDECGLVQGTPEAKGVVMTFQTQGNQKWYCTRGGCAYEPNRVTDHDADMREERPCGCEVLSKAIDQAIRDMLSGGHPFETGVANAINDLRAAQKETRDRAIPRPGG